jgi:hypothetical protein
VGGTGKIKEKENIVRYWSEKGMAKEGKRKRG